MEYVTRLLILVRVGVGLEFRLQRHHIMSAGMCVPVSHATFHCGPLVSSGTGLFRNRENIVANATLLNILNGIAKDARTNGDQSTFSVMEELWQRAFWTFQNTAFNYDGSAAYSTTYYIQQVPIPVSQVPPSWDSEMNMGITNIKQLGG